MDFHKQLRWWVFKLFGSLSLCTCQLTIGSHWMHTITHSLGARWGMCKHAKCWRFYKNSAKCVVMKKRSFEGLWAPPLPLPPLSHYSVSLAAANDRNPFCQQQQQQFITFIILPSPPHPTQLGTFFYYPPQYLPQLAPCWIVVGR